MGSLGQVDAGKEMFHGPSDPVVLELNRLENLLREKERELGNAHCEIKALKMTEALKDKAVVELSKDLKKHDEKMRSMEKQLEHKNLEIRRLGNERKEALSAQFAAEATLRRVHTTQKDEEVFPFEAIIAPLESDIKKYKHEIAVLQDDKKALERHVKWKEAALVEAGNILRSALERALIVEDVQNQNIELKKQMEIYHEENKLLEKTNRQKVLEIEKLTQTINQLEESILATGTVANAVRFYESQVSKLNEEKRMLERELARAKVYVNRVAMVTANEWKDDSEKVMPVKRWLEERRLLQGEMQRLRDKMSLAEKSAKVEAQLKEKLKKRVKTLEEDLKNESSSSAKEINKQITTTKRSTSQPRQSSTARVSQGIDRKRSTSQPRASVAGKVLKQPNSESPNVDKTRSVRQTDSPKVKAITVTGDRPVRKNLWAPRSKMFDDTGKENKKRNVNMTGHLDASDVERHCNAKPQNVSIAMDEYEVLCNKCQEEAMDHKKSKEEKEGIFHTMDGSRD